MDEPEDKLLTRREAAEYLRLKPHTLAVWYSQRRHALPVVKVGRQVRYRLSDLRAWLDSRVQTSQ